jgi:hypothetical protein
MFNYEDSPFDLTNLDQAKLDHLAYILASPAWMDFFKPYIEATIRGLEAQLVDPAGHRKWERPDDFIRGGVITLRGLLAFPEYIQQEAREHEVAESKVKTEEAHYEERATTGHIGPMGFRYDNPQEF